MHFASCIKCEFGAVRYGYILDIDVAIFNCCIGGYGFIGEIDNRPTRGDLHGGIGIYQTIAHFIVPDTT